MFVSSSIDSTVVVVFVFAVIITILSIILLVVVRINSYNRLRVTRPSRFSKYPLDMENLDDDLTILVTPSRPAVLGRTSVKGVPVVQITITPPTPARLPSKNHPQHR